MFAGEWAVRAIPGDGRRADTGVLGSALTGALGAARLLFGMGRDGVLPRQFFAHIHSDTNTPTYNILLVGAIAYIAVLSG
jgi:putrescine importer